MQDATGARFPILADPIADAANGYGIFDLLGDGVAAPATFIITGETLIAQHIGEDIADRVPVPEILSVLRQLRNSGGTAS